MKLLSTSQIALKIRDMRYAVGFVMRSPFSFIFSSTDVRISEFSSCKYSLTFDCGKRAFHCFRLKM